MELKELLRMVRIAKITQIAVSGPQRSGTGIAAYILAKELKSNFVHETAFDRNDYMEFVRITASKNPFVIQCPGLLHCAERFAENILIIVVCRSLSEILQEQRLHGWNELEEKQLYQDYKIFDMTRPVAYIKYQFAERIVSKTRRIEYLEYDSMEEHKLFLTRFKRDGFKYDQIVPGKKTPKTVSFKGKQP